MKTPLKYIIICVVFLLFTGACEQIGNNERWKPEEENMLPEEERSTVLVEEYTGQNCINCPTAAVELKKISGNYPKNIITVSMHALRTGQVKEELASTAADAYATEYNVPNSVPGILINRRNITREGKYSQKKALWSSLIRQAINTKARYRINLSAEQAVDKKINIKVSAFSQQDNVPSTKLGIQLWVVEDIRTEQMLPTGKKADYFHHNVLREALNEISGADYSLGETYYMQAILPKTVKEKSNAKIIAFLFNRDTQEVYEAAIVALGRGIHPDEADETDGEKKPEIEKKDFISFFYNDSTLPAFDGEVKALTIRYSNASKTDLEVISPLIYVCPSKKASANKFTLEITKEDHKGEQYGGLSQICTDQCQISESSEKYIKQPYELDDLKSFIQVHYKIAREYENKKADYRVRVSIKSNEKEVACLHLVFCYDPNKKTNNILDTIEPEQEQPNSERPDSKPELPPAPNPKPPTPLLPLNPEISMKSNVVALDFTGKLCPACPWTIEQLAEYDKAFHPNLIVVTIQVWYYCRDINLWPQEATEYKNFNASRIDGYPTVIFNNSKKGYDLYNDINSLIEQQPSLVSSITARRQERSIELSFLSNPQSGAQAMNDITTRKLNVLFWITENNIVDFQANRSHNYIHNHILRGSLNGLWGEVYVLGCKLHLQKELPSKVQNATNCNLIAIVLDTETKEFIDAVKITL